MTEDMQVNDNNHGPAASAAGNRGRLQRALEHARRVAETQSAGRGVLDPDGAAIWLRFCAQAGIEGCEPHN